MRNYVELAGSVEVLSRSCKLLRRDSLRLFVGACYVSGATHVAARGGCHAAQDILIF